MKVSSSVACIKYLIHHSCQPLYVFYPYSTSIITNMYKPLWLQECTSVLGAGTILNFITMFNLLVSRTEGKGLIVLLENGGALA